MTQKNSESELREMKELINKIDTYGFECEGGPLANCVQWIQLKKIVGVIEVSK